MIKLLLLSAPGNEHMSGLVEAAFHDSAAYPKAQAARGPECSADRGVISLRRFPDGETYVRVETPVRGRDVAIVCTLDRPDDKILPLFFLAATARDLGATSVGLIAPYLAYMRQDRRFADGEGVTSSYFASLLSRSFDWLVTVDPHLHRRASLGEVYAIPTEVVHAAPRVAEWIRTNVRRPLLVGPDSESAQWTDAVGRAAGAPSIVLAKVRRGDRDVAVTVPDVERWHDHTPVLVDDIISTAKTMIETVRHLERAGLAPPACIGVHGVFAAGAFDELRAAGAATIVTCNTISHPSNVIDLSRDIAGAVANCASSAAAHRATPG